MEDLISPQSRKIKREGIPHLPGEVIIEEILARLPVKSLLKFRCVAKSWCSLIASKKFMKTHLENSIKTSRFALHPISCTLHRISYTVVGTDQVCLPSLFDKPFTDHKTFNADLGIDSDLPIELVGCCNGLVCLLIDGKRFILWNPATKKFNNLPDFYNKIEYIFKIELYGFGFDELNDDYKVFAQVCEYYATGDVYSNVYSIVYSLRNNSWNVIEESVSVWPRDFAGMYVNGKLHWYKYGDIISFDLNSYVYGVVQLPIDPKEYFIRLGVVGGCLSAYYYNRNLNMGLDVWILKDYGVKESWDKVATVPYYYRPKRPVNPTPICGSDNMIYNTKSDEFRHSNITSYDVFRHMCIYHESLASVAPDGEQAR